MIKIIGGPKTHDIKVFCIYESGVEVEIKDIFCIKFNDILPGQNVKATIEIMAKIDIETDNYNIIKKCISKEK